MQCGPRQVREYQFQRVLNVGSTDITYFAHDVSLGREVAIKEYLPRDYTVRTDDHSVQPRSPETSEDYAWGLECFLDEALTLVLLNHPSIVRLHTYFKAHGTAYIVMEYIDGETLHERLEETGTLTEAELTAILHPLVEGLKQVHQAGFIHRDITPKNILLRKDGTPVLIDFGSARQTVEARSHSSTAVVTPGYAPPEQYSSRGQQGPWTDIYGLCAVAYRCITGTAPLDATDRIQGGELASVAKAGRGKYSERLLTAVDQGLSLIAGERPQHLEGWRSMLLEVEPTEAPETAEPENASEQNDLGVGHSGLLHWLRYEQAWPILGLFGALALLAVLLGFEWANVFLKSFATLAVVSAVLSIILPNK